VTLLSILANQSIAVPLAGTFPAVELRYVLNECQASILFSGSQKDSHEVLKACEDELVAKELGIVAVEGFAEKSEPSSSVKENVKWEDAMEAEGGIMLFTSGTTNRPVWQVLPLEPDLFYLLLFSERRPALSTYPNCSISISPPCLEVYVEGSLTPYSATPSHSRNSQCFIGTTFCWRKRRVYGYL
jgi:hypothetical protein